MAETVSVLIATYNCARFLPQCLESISAQTHQPHEVIVVDDGSKDNTKEVMRGFPHVRYVQAEHGGKSAAFNRAVSEAKGDILCHLDADDYWSPRKLERVCKELAKKTSLGGAIHDVEHVDEVGTRIRGQKLARGTPSVITLESWADVDFLYSIPGARGFLGGHPNTTVVRRSALVDLFPLRTNVGLFVDGIFVLGALRYGLLYLPEVLSAYRHHGHNAGLGQANQCIDAVKMFQFLLGKKEFRNHLSDRDTGLIKARILEKTARYACLTGNDKVRGAIAGIQVPFVLLRSGLLFNWRHLALPLMCFIPVKRPAFKSTALSAWEKKPAIGRDSSL